MFVARFRHHICGSTTGSFFLSSCVVGYGWFVLIQSIIRWLVPTLVSVPGLALGLGVTFRSALPNDLVNGLPRVAGHGPWFTAGGIFKDT